MFAEGESIMKFFISHSSKNRELVKLFVELLHTKLGVSKGEIYCTSIQNQVKPGKNIFQDIRDNLVNAEFVVFLITEDYLRSIYCLMEMGAAWVYKENIIPIIVPPISFKTLQDTPLGAIKAYSLGNADDIGTMLYDYLVSSSAIQRLDMAEEQAFIAGLPEFVKHIKQCILDMSGANQLENISFIAVASNGNDQAIQLNQERNRIEMAIDFSQNLLYGPCRFVSSVAQFSPLLNWSQFINSEAYLQFKLESPDKSVSAVTIEIKATDRLITCFEKTYYLTEGQQDVILKIHEMTNLNLLGEIAEICIVSRPNQVPAYRGTLYFQFLGMFYE